MSNRIATVTPADGLNLREAPSRDGKFLGLLAQGQQVTITAAAAPPADAWRRVETPLGPGFVHGAYISVDGVRAVTEEPPGLDPVMGPPKAPPEDRTGAPEPQPTYTVVTGDTLSGIGAKLGLNWHDIAAANAMTPPFSLSVNQVLKLPVAPPVKGVIEILNPLSEDCVVTSSSAQGHHVPYGGNRSCDLDSAAGSSQGKPVRFAVSPPPHYEIRGVVTVIGDACASGVVADGGRKVQLRLEYRSAGTAEWLNSGAWVLYSHLDPVKVAVGAEISPDGHLGFLGPEGGGEYDSDCARGSHTHIEATRGMWVIDEEVRVGPSAVIKIAL